MKKLSILPILFLTACATTNPTAQIITNDKLKVIKPSDAMYNCPTIKEFPNPDKLTDIQVGKLLVTLYQNNNICKNSLDSIKKFLDSAEREIGK